MAKKSKSDARVSGVYLIRIKPTNKVYIGSSVDIRRRFKLHMLCAFSDAPTVRDDKRLYKDIRKYGKDSIEFEILCATPDMKNVGRRLLAEEVFIHQYDACNPDRGYNTVNTYMSPGLLTPRKQSDIEKIKRAKAVILYDSITGGALLFFGGAKEVGKHFGYTKDKQYGKDIMSHAIKQLSLVRDRYYIFYANSKMREEQISRVLNSGKSKSLNVPKRKALARVIDEIEVIAHDTYGFN